MGLFERLGEKVERFKQEAVAARDESADHRCRNCDAEIYSNQKQCPECGSTEIGRVTDVETETTDSSETVETTEEAATVEAAGAADGTGETEDDEHDAVHDESEKAQKTDE